MRGTPTRLALLATIAVSLALVGAELGRGAFTLGTAEAPHPCTAVVSLHTSGYVGYDAKLQEIALQGLDVAACRLGTSPARLALALRTPSARRHVAHGRNLQAVIRRSLERAIDIQRRAGHLNAIDAFLARQAVARTPLSLVEQILGI